MPFESRHFDDYDHLLRYLNSFGKDYIFRGQVKHYKSSDGQPILEPSLIRMGCHPGWMYKWTYYAKDCLSVLSSMTYDEVSIDYAAALLQHYGWRSHFIDATTDFRVAAWFAANRFESMNKIRLVDDCMDISIYLLQNIASYIPDTSQGNIYVLSKEQLKNWKIKLIDLSEIEVNDSITRCMTQKACLLGPLREELPPDCIIARITAPSKILQLIANEGGFCNTNSLFPRADKDIFLRIFLSVPWEFAQSINGTPIFTRGLKDIPEYEDSLKHSFGPEVAFYIPFWIADDRGPTNSCLGKAVYYRLPGGAIFLKPNEENFIFPNINKVLRAYGSLVLEDFDILSNPEYIVKGVSEYYKGIYLNLISDNLVEVSAIYVDQKGTSCLGVAVDQGWSYSIDTNGRWTRKNSINDCPCNRIHRHKQHLWLLDVVEEMLAKSEFKKINENDFAHISIIKQIDSEFIQ